MITTKDEKLVPSEWKYVNNSVMRETNRSEDNRQLIFVRLVGEKSEIFLFIEGTKEP